MQNWYNAYSNARNKRHTNRCKPNLPRPENPVILQRHGNAFVLRREAGREITDRPGGRHQGLVVIGAIGTAARVQHQRNAQGGRAVEAGCVQLYQHLVGGEGTQPDRHAKQVAVVDGPRFYFVEG